MENRESVSGNQNNQQNNNQQPEKNFGGANKPAEVNPGKIGDQDKEIDLDRSGVGTDETQKNAQPKQQQQQQAGEVDNQQGGDRSLSEKGKEAFQKGKDYIDDALKKGSSRSDVSKEKSDQNLMGQGGYGTSGTSGTNSGGSQGFQSGQGSAGSQSGSTGFSAKPQEPVQEEQEGRIEKDRSAQGSGSQPVQ